MLQKLFATGLVLCACNAAFSQDSTKTPALEISGSVDTYYKYDFAKTSANNYTSFTKSHNSFELGMASLKFEYKTGKTEMVADLGFGNRAKEFSYNDDGITAAVKQLYISYLPTSWLKLTAGSWYTHIGYEVADAYANRNYSMSYLFSNGPFFHTGVKADITSGKSTFMIGLTNPPDRKTVPDDLYRKLSVIAQYSYQVSDNVKATFGYVNWRGADTSKGSQYDVVITGTVNKHFNLAVNGSLATRKMYEGSDKFTSNKNWWGTALYLNYDANDLFGLTLREEYFDDKNSTASAQLNGHVLASTLSGHFTFHSLTFIPEIRIEHSNNSDMFVKSSGDPTKSAGNFLIAAIYKF
ncbi:outer membrane beta-barrel protein [Deminuibacter soli]|uniref:Porin n=1 Tax=Deminuibacter soli TaxID=2291815 RepID=A0A3E1NI37_9BACT|nr:outer membrane beta-barrel protein [Deminuibacter soli]RFM27590.1 porin [Deminuibacter soli]